MCHGDSGRRWPRTCRRSIGSATAEEAYFQLEAFAEKWDGAHPTISQMWRRNWEHLTPFFGYPADIRKVIYTTNAIESLNDYRLKPVDSCCD